MQYQNELNSIIEAIKIISPDAFSFAGKTHASNINKPYPFQGTMTTDPLVRSITDVLYQQFYCRKFTGAYYEQVPVTEGNAMFQEALSDANSTIERWDNDWIIEQILPTGQYVAYKNGKYKFLYPGEFITASHEGLLPKAGTRIAIHCFKESRSTQPGFYFVFSNEIHDQQDLSMLVRFYWNVKNSGAANLIKLLTQNLNKYKVPFSFKCVNNAALFTRSDAAVLYLAKHDFHISAQVLGSIYGEIEKELNNEVPLFTKKLNSGLSLAEDPATGESFGMSRCGIIAEGIKNAYQNGQVTNEKTMYEIHQSFAARGIQMTTPYLNAGSKDIYNFTV
jgi:hypothetical protein